MGKFLELSLMYGGKVYIRKSDIQTVRGTNKDRRGVSDGTRATTSNEYFMVAEDVKDIMRSLEVHSVE